MAWLKHGDNQEDLYAQILGIKSPWRVSNVDLAVPKGEVTVRVEPEKGARHCCPTCGEESPGYDSRQRRWRHLDTCQYKTILVADVLRVKCRAHGVVTVSVPWAEPGSGFTAMFEALVIDWLKEASTSAVSRLMDLSWNAIPTDEAVMKILYLALHQIARRWTMPIRDWKQAMSQFMILFGDRASH